MANKCDPRAYAKCPDREKCGPLQNAIFTDGSECDEFNQKVINAPPTNADRIRAMSDEELAAFLESVTASLAIKLGGEYIVRAKDYINLWLQQPAEEVQGDG